MRAVGIGALRLLEGRHRLLADEGAEVDRSAARLVWDLLLQIARGLENGDHAPGDRAGVEGAVAVGHDAGRAVEHADAVDRYVELAGEDLRHRGLVALARAGRADIDIEAIAAAHHDARRLGRAGAARLDEAGHPQTMQPAVGLLAA